MPVPADMTCTSPGRITELVRLGIRDFHEVIASPVPTMDISEFIGVPAEDRATFRTWSDARVAGTAGMPGHEEGYRQASADIESYFDDHIARRRRELDRGQATCVCVCAEGEPR